MILQYMQAPSVVPHSSNMFSYKTTEPVKAKFDMRPKWVGATKVCLPLLGHITKMAATPIYGKNVFRNLLQNQGTNSPLDMGVIKFEKKKKIK